METHSDNMDHASATAARDRVLTDLKSLIRDSQDLLKVTAHDVSEKANGARARLTVAVERANTTCRELQEQTVAKAKAAAHKADTTIRAHPYEAICVGFGLGLLVGLLVRRNETVERT